MTSIAEKKFLATGPTGNRADIANIFDESSMFDAHITSVNRSRRLMDVAGHYLYDFAAQDYLGMSHRPEVIEAAVDGVRKYGTLHMWCRLVGTFNITDTVEKKLADLIGADSINIFQSVTILSHGVIPALLGRDGIIFLDKSAHATMYEGAKIARDNGATLVNFETHDLESLEAQLKENKDVQKKLIAVDGVYSMTGTYSALPALDALAKKYDALLYVDDAHGFGVVGENPSESHPYGHKGNGIVRYYGLDFENILYVGTLAKSFGASAGFIACSKKMRNFFLSQATPHDYSKAGRIDNMCIAARALEINESEGDQIRKQLYDNTKLLTDGLHRMGFSVSNNTGFPVVIIRVSADKDLIKLSNELYRSHILLTLSPYPMVKRGEEGLRVTITASHTCKEIEYLLDLLSTMKDKIV